MDNFLMMSFYNNRETRIDQEQSLGGILSFFARFGSDNIKRNRL